MTVTKVDIYNDACTHLGVDPDIESDTEDTKKARVFNAIWDSSRKHCLKRHDWGCAKEFFDLVVVGTKPLSWGYQYKWDNQMLSPRFIQNTNRKADRIPFSSGTYSDDDNGRIRVIWTDQADAIMCGTYDLEEPNLMSEELQESIAAYMAFKSSHQFTDSKSIKNQAYEFYQMKIAEGAQIDALQEADDPEQEAPWIRSRGGTADPLPQVIRE